MTTLYHIEEQIEKSLYQVRYNPQGLIPSSKLIGVEHIYIFNFEHTLIIPKKGKYINNSSNWEFVKPRNVIVLKNLYERIKDSGGHIVVYSNIAISERSINNKIILTDLIKLTKSVAAHLEIPITFYFSVGHDQYRKPKISAFNCSEMAHQLDSSKVEYVVGHAYVERKNEDLEFANNLGVPFIASPDYFDLEQEQIDWICQLQRHPLGICRGNLRLKLPREIQRQCGEMEKIAIMMMGPPASGKSTLAKLMEKRWNFKIVSHDLGNTLERVLFDDNEDDFDSDSDSVSKIVIDNNHRDIIQRTSMVDNLKRNGFGEIILIQFKWPKWVCMTLCKLRNRNTSENAINAYLKRRDPIMKIEEGYSRIITFDPLNKHRSKRLTVS